MHTSGAVDHCGLEREPRPVAQGVDALHGGLHFLVVQVAHQPVLVELRGRQRASSAQQGSALSLYYCKALLT